MKTILAIALMTTVLGATVAPTVSQAMVAAPAKTTPGGGSPGPSSNGYEGQSNVNQCVPMKRKLATGKLVYERCWSAR